MVEEIRACDLDAESFITGKVEEIRGSVAEGSAINASKPPSIIEAV